MAKKIIDLVQEKIAAMKEDPNDSDEVKRAKADAADALSREAVVAINDGIKSRSWETYMRQFVDKDANGSLNPAQLARLLADDGTLGDVNLDRRRAYLVGNAVCGSGSPNTANLGNNVSGIDDGI
jgi:hypothetical protein